MSQTTDVAFTHPRYYEIGRQEVKGTVYVLAEHSTYGDEVAARFWNTESRDWVRDEDGFPVPAHNGFDDLEEFFDLAEIA